MKRQAYIIDLLDNRLSTVSADFGPVFFPSNRTFSFMQSDIEHHENQDVSVIAGLF